jgi:hypothetical protein
VTTEDQAALKFYRLEAEYWLRTVEAESQAKPDTKLNEQRALLAKERRDLARQIYENRLEDIKKQGRFLDVEALYVWSRRWPDAQGDTIDLKAAKIAPLEQHLARMKAMQPMVARLVHEGARDVTAVDVDRVNFFYLEAEFLLSQARGDPKVALARERRILAPKIYEETSAEYARRLTSDQRERTYRWSRRWLEAQRNMSDLKAAQVAACNDHLDRLRTLRAQTVNAIKEGTSRYLRIVDVDAVDFYMCEGRLWLLLAEGK